MTQLHRPSHTPPHTPPQTPTLPHVSLKLLALLTLSGTLAMHVFAPALPFVVESLHTSAASAQLTISVYIAGLAIGQLIYGPVADRWGRRPTLMFGTALFTAGSIAAALAPNIQSLIAARAFQAFGGCAGLLLGRTILRDTAAPQEMVRRMALMNLMITLGPAVAPLIGAALAPWLGWRVILLGMALLGVVNLGCCFWLLPETAPARTDADGQLRELARRYGGLLRSPRFVGYAIGGGCATTATYGYITAAPFIFVRQLQRPPQEIGIYLTLVIVGIWLGSAAAARLARRLPPDRLLLGGQALSTAASLALLAVVSAGGLSVTALVACMGVFTLGVGMASPGAITQALAVDPRVAGTATGLYGCTQMAVGATCSALVVLGRNPALSTALVLAGASLVGQVCLRLASQSPVSANGV